MPNNSLLREFLDLQAYELAQQITEIFDENIENDDETAIERLKDKFNAILEEKINEIG